MSPAALTPVQNVIRMGPRGGTTTQPPKRFQPWYEAIADLMLAEPNLRKGEIATRLGRREAWISVICSTDMFKAYYEQRRQVFNAALSERITGKLSAVTEAALDCLAEGIRKKGETLNVTERAVVLGGLLEKLGYGSKNAPAVNVNVTATANTTQLVDTPVSVEALVEARASLRALEELRLARNTAQTIEHMPASPPTAGAMQPDTASLDALMFD